MQVEGRKCPRLFPLKIAVQPGGGFVKDRKGLLLVLGGEKGGEILLALDPEAAQALLGGRQRDREGSKY